MCPLRFILVFFSAALAGYLAWRTISSSSSDDDDEFSFLTKPDQEDHHDDEDNNSSKQELQFLKMIQTGFWVFVDMASGRYLWRNVKELKGQELIKA